MSDSAGPDRGHGFADAVVDHGGDPGYSEREQHHQDEREFLCAPLMYFPDETGGVGPGGNFLAMGELPRQRWRAIALPLGGLDSGLVESSMTLSVQRPRSRTVRSVSQPPDGTRFMSSHGRRHDVPGGRSTWRNRARPVDTRDTDLVRKRPGNRCLSG